MGTVLPREHAWALMADGLHIHRFFLHVDPLLRQYAWQLDRARRGDTRRLDFDVVAPEVLATPEAPIDWAVLPEHLLRPWPAREDLARVGEASIRVVPVVRAATPVGVRAVPARGTDVTRIGAALRLLDEAGLGFVPELAVRVVLLRRDADRDSATIAPADGPIRPDAPRTIIVPDGGSAAECAERLLLAAAATLLYLFFLIDRPVPDPLPDHLDAMLEDAGELYYGSAPAFASALRLRFVQWSLQAAPGASDADERARLSARARRLETSISRARAATYALIDRIDDVRVRDLLETTIPGPRRFAKFANGTGPGQSA